ncbi:ubiquinol oxidase subunit II [Stakelama marina]|uniref:Ubiquinol oxidase subunit 2 n=1 Tax=Stakelama marina TaxID=2826939 RepID=A0A8T4ILH7_9SPHN|nr:ubiquinol oxidase subunit II [Stakelama marina]MBR0553016.1 COX aromatic rich motif-containing protein [Stakelama marina]
MFLALAGCGAFHDSFFNAAGPIAGQERHLFIIVSIVMLFVIGPVLILTPIIAWHYRLSNTKHAYRPHWSFSWILEFFIWVPPTLIVIGLSFLLWNYTHKLDPYRPIESSQPTLEVRAVSLDWKWLFIYPRQHVATVNMLAIPAGRPVHIEMTSGTVMQSLMIPQLAGQIYTMGGMTTQLHIQADHPGTYTGQNTQYNGEGFAKQKFAVNALAPQQFDEWIAHVRATGKPFDAKAYHHLFEKSVEKQPILFSSAPDGLFQRILDRYHPTARASDTNPEVIRP